jgi:DNA-binding NarL/FixJ family response regulator
MSTASAITAGGDPTPARRVKVSIAVSDPLLARWIGSLVSGDHGLEVVIGLDDGREQDVTVADHVDGLPAPLIIIDDEAHEPDELGADVRAVLQPSVDGELLRAAIRVVAAGFTIADAREPHGFSGRAPQHDEPKAVTEDGDITLSARESEVMALLAHGASNKLIARELGISVHTAKFHVASVLAKLGARNRSDAVAIGMRRGLILL